MFDSRLIHPAYFNCDFKRQPSKHASHAITFAKIYTKKRMEGVLFRKKWGVRYEGDNLEPPPQVEEVEDEEGKKVVIPHRNAILGRLTVLSASLLNLKSVHLIGKNSPYVRVSCGSEFQVTTEPKYKAGSDAEWQVKEAFYSSSSKSSSGGGSGNDSIVVVAEVVVVYMI